MRSFADHLASPHDAPVPAGGVEGCAGGACGDLVRYFLTVNEDGRIASCAVRARGRDVAVATASAFAEAAEGLTVLEAARLNLASLHADFAELGGDDLDRARVMEDGLHHAIGAWLRSRMREGARGLAAGRVDGAAPECLVAMSGGVDSAVALHAEHQRAHGRVAGITLRLWIDPQAPDPEAACCSPDSVRRARATCHALGLPHISLDLRGAFAREVVRPFISEYQEGLTPNPCVRCNGSFRLDELVACADVVGARSVATGHYIRTVERDGVTLARRGVDRRKDQSYMVATLAPGTLARLRFPLGERQKADTRRQADELGLVQARAPESQEICFLGGGDYRGFLARAGALGPAGKIVDEQGTVLGEHEGIAAFTPGQRRGLDLQRVGESTAPLYVAGTDPQTGTVTVAPRERIRTSTVTLEDAVCHAPGGVRRAAVELRYRSMAGSADVRWGADGSARLRFDEPVAAPAPGQVACLYDDDGVVVGAGRIVRPGR